MLQATKTDTATNDQTYEGLDRVPPTSVSAATDDVISSASVHKPLQLSQETD